MRGTRVGLIFAYTEGWIGGTYYVVNLIRSLETVKQSGSPEVFVLHTKPEDYRYLASQTGYEKLHPLKIQETPRLLRAINRLGTKALGRDLFPWRLRKTQLDVLFPASEADYFSSVRHRIFWVPDFQERHYPGFFSVEAHKIRKDTLDRIVAFKAPLVVSSQSAKDDFLALYPKAENPVFVLPFAVTLPQLAESQLPEIQKQYGLDRPYFFCANQFWAHKNHKCLLDALRSLSQKGEPPLVVFSGKQEDSRDPGYFSTLQSLIEEYGLAPSTKFLGFIDRQHQLLLMKGSQGVIQPSLFEGWSTVVEDCKALGVPMLVSRIPVHLEQEPPQSAYFNPLDSEDLAQKIRDFSGQHYRPHYQENIEAFASGFLRILVNQTGRAEETAP